MNLKSFTLIEVLVVIVVVGILSSFLIVATNNITESTNDAKRKNDIASLQKLLLSYKTMYGNAPIEATECDIRNDASGCTTLKSALVPDHTQLFPTDPSGTYYKYQSTDGSDFTVKATLSTNYKYQYSYSSGFSEIEPFTYVEFTSSGSWQVPSDVTSIDVIVVGGGGGGKGGHNYDYGGSYYGGGGGNNGITTTQNSISVTPGQTLTITIGSAGSGGAGGTSTCGNGLAGGQSSITGTGVSVTASGGVLQSSDYTSSTGGPGSNGYGSGTYAINGTDADNCGEGTRYGGLAGTGYGAGGGGGGTVGCQGYPGGNGGNGASGYIKISNDWLLNIF